MLRYFREFLVCGFEGTCREVIFGLSLFFIVLYQGKNIPSLLMCDALPKV